MTEFSALAKTFDRADAQFFVQYPNRKAHIRKCYRGEHEAEFRTLGFHETERRRILLCRFDFEGNFLPGNKVLKIPFLLFGDETVEDRDDILVPIINELMYNAKAGMQQ